MPFHLNLHEFHIQKIGNKPDEYEDSFSYDIASGRFAMADGASESAYSGLWARSLTSAYVSHYSGSSLIPVIETARKQWLNGIRWDGMKWFVRNKVMRGSYSTFLGLSFSGDNHYRAIGVGDTCLFHINEGEVTSFPIRDQKEFGNTPILIWSGNPFSGEVKIPKWVYYVEGEIDEGDILIMATDSYSHWFMKNIDRSPWENMLSDQAEETRFIQGLIAKKEMKNDDVTYAVITSGQLS